MLEYKLLNTSYTQDVYYSGAISRVRGRKLQIDSSYLLLYLDTVTQDDILSKAHKVAVKKFNNTARYTPNVILSYDRWLEIEKLGMSRYSRKYSTVISFSDSLDLILSSMLSINDKQLVREAISNKCNYVAMSRGILTQNEYLLDICKASDLVNVHPKLDEFLAYLYQSTDKSKMRDYNGGIVDLSSLVCDTAEEKFNMLFNCYVLRYARNILASIVTNYYRELKENNSNSILLSSEGVSEMVMYSDIDINEDIKIIMPSGEELIATVRSFKEKEYANYISDKTSF